MIKLYNKINCGLGPSPKLYMQTSVVKHFQHVCYSSFITSFNFFFYQFNPFMYFHSRPYFIRELIQKFVDNAIF